MSKAKVHVLEDLLSGESMTVDQLTFGLETVLGMIGADSAVRFKQGNVLVDNTVVAIYQNSAYAWYGDYPKTIGVDTPDLEQGWKAIRNLYWVDVPESTSSHGIIGQMSFDSSYLYICIDTDTWVRATLGTW